MASRRHFPEPAASKQASPSTAKSSGTGSVLRNQGPETKATTTISRAVALAGIVIRSAIPALLSWGLTIGLIFGGCCSNVFALEAIVKEEPASGILITFVQFIVTALFTMGPHVSVSRAPSFLKPRAVPLMRWIPSTVMFFIVNIMNNFAFGYNISVPVHIILRSGGSVTTMLVGFAWGKRYSKAQVFGVSMLTVGVVIAAMADAQAKGKRASDPSTFENPLASFLTGLAVLFVAQLLSAIMGIYVQETYAMYGAHWHENLFYSHILSIPLFAPFYPAIRQQFNNLLASSPVILTLPSMGEPSWAAATNLKSWQGRILGLETSKSSPAISVKVPKHVLMLVLNSLTQYACIRGVNLLGARTSALGVTIVLNVRKLVSLFASLWLFGNELPLGVMIGAAVVFTGAAVYSWGGSSGLKGSKSINGKVKGGE